MNRIKALTVSLLAGLMIFLGIEYLPLLRAYASAPGAFVHVPDGYVKYYYPQKGVWSIVPDDMEFNTDAAPDYVRGENSYMDITFSLETAFTDEFDGSVAAYCDYYLDRFFSDEGWREQNGVTLISQEQNTTRKTTHLLLSDVPEGEPDGYMFLTVYSGTDLFWRVQIRYSSKSDKGLEAAELFCSSFQKTDRGGSEKYRFSPCLTLPEYWSDETLSLYNRLRSGDLYFGIFTSDIAGVGISETVPELEKQIGYSFPILLNYTHITEKFPSEFMQLAWEQGKVVELTLQITDSNNERLYGKSAQLALYRGEYDEAIREYARAAAEFGHPFLFRLNNEMNSDWTSWSGVVNLCDPQIYVWCWQHIYQIFIEEGATNAIWIFNPNDVDYPLCCWNSYLAYFPGEEYVQLIGLTGYNTGTYYSAEMGERWRSFTEIYDALESEYSKYFSEYPWIITEFASSSIGGDKAAWIDDMFADIHTRKNICAAVWFDFADYDFRDSSVVARPYFMAENGDCIEAFYRGLGLGGFSEKLTD